ncbi:MAG TPA: Arc family DNA-binding protein [archaeon]|nr:Arc family DNA-binding protein [archaeon]
MPTITLKNIPDELYGRLKESAADHRRSLNSEIIVQLEQAVLSARIDPDAFLAKADARRERLALPPLTERHLKATKTRGRP